MENKDIIFNCDFCKATFDNSGILTRHINQHLLNPEKFICTYCNKCFINQSNLIAHSQIHLSPIISDYICATCNKGFSRKSYLKRHQILHTKEIIKGDKRSNKINRHIHPVKLRHYVRRNIAKKFVCDECGKTLCTRASYRMHCLVHSKSRPYPCEHCDRSFLQMNLLKEHLNTHTKECIFKCEICDMTFAFKRNFIKHVQNKHLGVHLSIPRNINRPLSANSWNKFMENISEEEYKCKLCNFVFSDRNSLKMHIQMHHDLRTKSLNNKEPKITTCKYCQEHCSSQSSLLRHIRNRHFDEILNDDNISDPRLLKLKLSFSMLGKIFKCIFCNEQYESIKDLKRHVMDHVEHSKINENGKNISTYTLKMPRINLDSKSLEDKNKLAGNFTDYIFGRKYIPPQDKKFKCINCKVAFKAISSLNRHIFIVHVHRNDKKSTPNESVIITEKKIQNFSCKFCCGIFSSKHKLNTHLKTHILKSTSYISADTDLTRIIKDEKVIKREDKLDLQIFEEHAINDNGDNIQSGNSEQINAIDNPIGKFKKNTISYTAVKIKPAGQIVNPLINLTKENRIIKVYRKFKLVPSKIESPIEMNHSLLNLKSNPVNEKSRSTSGELGKARVACVQSKNPYAYKDNYVEIKQGENDQAKKYKPHKCPFCFKRFEKICNFKLHLREHVAYYNSINKKKNGKCTLMRKCSKCGKDFSSKILYDIHLNSICDADLSNCSLDKKKVVSLDSCRIFKNFQKENISSSNIELDHDAIDIETSNSTAPAIYDASIKSMAANVKLSLRKQNDIFKTISNIPKIKYSFLKKASIFNLT